MSSDKKLYSPGERAPRSGQYEIVGPRGGKKGGYEVTTVKGEPLPPTPKPKQKFRLTDPTRHKRK